MTDIVSPASPTRRVRLARLFSLAGPIVVSRAGILTMLVADMIMVGQYDAGELAQLALGVSLFVPVVVTGIGALQGVNVLVSQRFGAGDLEGCRDALRRGLPFALLVGALGAALLLLAPVWFALIGHGGALAGGAGAVAQILAPAVVLQVLYIVTAFFCEGAQNPRPAMMVMIAANLLNIAFNFLLISGPFGLPALGAEGAALSTTLTRLFFILAMGVYLLRSDFNGARAAMVDSLRGGWGPGGWAAARPLRRIGYAAAISMGAETYAYAAMTQAAGLLGALQLAAYTIVYNVEAVAFMTALGFASATGVLVGAAMGRRDRAEAAESALLGAMVVFAIMCVVALLAALFGREIAGLYVRDAEAASAAAGLFMIAGAWIALDGVQLTLANAGRAANDAWAVAGRQAFAYLLVMAPLGAALSHGLGFGAPGLVAAAGVGCATSATLLGLRLRATLSRAA